MSIPGGLSQNHDEPSLPDSTMMLHLLITLIGGQVEDYAEPVAPPEHLRQAVRCAPTPVLRGILLDAVVELDRRAAPGNDPRKDSQASQTQEED